MHTQGQFPNVQLSIAYCLKQSKVEWISRDTPVKSLMFKSLVYYKCLLISCGSQPCDGYRVLLCQWLTLSPPKYGKTKGSIHPCWPSVHLFLYVVNISIVDTSFILKLTCSIVFFMKVGWGGEVGWAAALPKYHDMLRDLKS